MEALEVGLGITFEICEFVANGLEATGHILTFGLGTVVILFEKALKRLGMPGENGFLLGQLDLEPLAIPIAGQHGLTIDDLEHQRRARRGFTWQPSSIVGNFRNADQPIAHGKIQL